eukprot:g4680.t1
MQVQNQLDRRYLQASGKQHDLGTDENPCRLFVSNLDHRVTEFIITEVLKRFGKIKRFEFLFQKGGKQVGTSLGVARVEFSNRGEAEEAMKKMNGKKLLGRRVKVDYHFHRQEDEKKETTETVDKSVVSRSSSTIMNEIFNIRRKLKEMEAQGLTKDTAVMKKIHHEDRTKSEEVEAESEEVEWIGMIGSTESEEVEAESEEVEAESEEVEWIGMIGSTESEEVEAESEEVEAESEEVEWIGMIGSTESEEVEAESEEGGRVKYKSM